MSNCAVCIELIIPQQLPEVDDLIVICPGLWMEKQRLIGAYSLCSGYCDVLPRDPFRTERFIVTATGKVVNRQHSAVRILGELPAQVALGLVDLKVELPDSLNPSQDNSEGPSSLPELPVRLVRPSLRNFIVAPCPPLPNPASFSSLPQGLIPKALPDKSCMGYSPFQSHLPRNPPTQPK